MGSTAEPLADSVRLYLREIGRIPLLTAVDEVSLAKAVEVGVLAEERCATTAGLTEQDRADLSYLIEAGHAAKATLVRSNLRLVVAVAKRYTGAGTSLLDLVQEGNIGLMRAVEKFDYRRGFKFSTYATWWIRQAVSRGLADQSRTIRVPVHVVEAMNRAVRAQRALLQASGRPPTICELAEHLALTPEQTQDLLQLVEEPISLDVSVGEDERGQLADLIVDDHNALPGDEVGVLMLHADVSNLLALVTDRERRVLQLRYGLEGGRRHTLEEVGAALGVTRERARQIEARAFVRIRRTQSLDNYRDYLN